MSRKTNHLSIGDLSKITGAGIKSLRYYERIGILTPAYTCPDSKYRYYTIDQTNLVWTIMFCIELDMPLSEMAKFIEPDGTMDFHAFFAKGRAVAGKKMDALKKGLSMIDLMEAQMNIADQHKTGEIYTRHFPEKHLHTKPLGSSLKDANLIEVSKIFADFATTNPDILEYETLEFGALRITTPTNTTYYAYMEVTFPQKTKSTITIPAGEYLCRQAEETQLEHTEEILKHHLKEPTSFIAIETDVLTGRHKINNPLNELRVIGGAYAN